MNTIQITACLVTTGIFIGTGPQLLHAADAIGRASTTATATSTQPSGSSTARPAIAGSRPTSRPGGAIVPPPRRDVPGRRGTLSGGAIYVPDFFDASLGEGTEVVIWFLGATWCAEQTFYDAHKNAVLIVAGGKDLAVAFKDPAAMGRLLDDALAWLRREGIATRPVQRLCLASFSGGFSGVREILRQPASAARITDIVLADSLYAPRVPGHENRLDPEAMRPFLDYAKRAAGGECTLWFSHLYPPEERYRSNTTTLAASYLIDQLGLARTSAATKNSRGARLLYRADKKGLHVLGYAGMTNQDHFDHFYAAGDLLRETSLTAASAAR